MYQRDKCQKDSKLSEFTVLQIVFEILIKYLLKHYLIYFENLSFFNFTKKTKTSKPYLTPPEKIFKCIESLELKIFVIINLVFL